MTRQSCNTNGAIWNIRHDPKNTQLEYKIVDFEGNEYTEKGAYIIVNGWRCTICPFKASITETQAKTSERLERVCKDVECFFGKNKGRWRVLKLQLQKMIDNIYRTCCILQNMLYAYGGLAELEVNTDWTGNAGLHD
ncbi:unnamed protein product, partial [Discosporangium mesarthrocarpum]